MKLIQKIQIIAEIGTSHGGDIEKARKLVDAAAEAGADYAKFQIVYADEILHPDTGIVDLPGGPVRLYDTFKELEVPVEFFIEMSQYCKIKNLQFLCTPFGIRSARELKNLSPSSIKIASPELNHFPLLREVSGYGVPLILSTGVSCLRDIENALSVTTAAPERILLHCVTSYPAPEEDYNLRILKHLEAIFGVPVGVSDHSLDPVLVPLLSAACGGSMIEKHITLSKTDGGLDDTVALTPDLFRLMVDSVRSAQGKTGSAVIEEMRGQYGAERIEKILGTGKKELAPSELENYGRTNRSIHYLHTMKAGKRIEAEDVALLRTEKVLSPGLKPEFLHDITGKILTLGVESGAGARWADFMSDR